MVGRDPPQPGKRRRRGTDADEDAAAGKIMYEDFFGPGGQAGKASCGRATVEPECS